MRGVSSASTSTVRAGLPCLQRGQRGACSRRSCWIASLSPPRTLRVMFCIRFSMLSISASISSVSIVSASATGIDPALDMGHVAVLKAAQHMGDRVHLADIGQELVAQPLALAGAFDEAGDVDEGHARGDDLLAPRDLAIEGYFRELESPEKLVAKLAGAGVNGFITRPGFGEPCHSSFGRAGWVQRLTGRTGIGVAVDPMTDLDQLTLHSVEQALRNGADAVVPTYFLGGEHEVRDLPMLGKISDTCAMLGLPLMAEVFPVGGSDATPYNGPYSVSDMQVAVRTASEMGADMIKTWYSGSDKSFKKIVDYSLVPILIAGGPKADKPSDVLEIVKGAMDAGARGTTVGRKIWQSKNAGAMAHAVCMIVHEGADVGTAMKALN